MQLDPDVPRAIGYTLAGIGVGAFCSFTANYIARYVAEHRIAKAMMAVSDHMLEVASNCMEDPYRLFPTN